jgi:hypothetical protein
VLLRARMLIIAYELFFFFPGIFCKESISKSPVFAHNIVIRFVKIIIILCMIAILQFFSLSQMLLQL